MQHTTYNMLSNGCFRAGAVAVGYHNQTYKHTTIQHILARTRSKRANAMYVTPGYRVTQLYTEPPGTGGFCPRTVAVITRA